jgi:hypothetical protein
MENEENRYASKTQLALARLYRLTGITGLALIMVMFLVYISGLVTTNVPVDEVEVYWHLDAAEYARQTGTPVGWNFLGNLAYGESLSFGSLVFMALAVIICLITMVVIFLKRRNLVFAAVVLLQTAVLLIAATGVVSAH